MKNKVEHIVQEIFSELYYLIEYNKSVIFIYVLNWFKGGLI